MSYQHKELAAGRWKQLPFVEQMAHISGEVERALELIDLTLDNAKNIKRLKEIARPREALADFFAGSNEFSSTAESWRKYFSFFA